MAASTQVITDLGTVITTGPAVATAATASNPNGPIMDYIGNIKLAQLKLQEVKALLAPVITITDSSTDSTNKTLLQNVQLTLS